jgi:hypothetical protein
VQFLKYEEKIAQNVNQHFYIKQNFIRKETAKFNSIIQKKVKVKSSMSEVKWDYLKQNTS